jgi:hypothetical protein
MHTIGPSTIQLPELYKHSMTKLLAFVFWELRGFFRDFLYDDGYSDWKALAVMCCVEIMAIMAAVFIASLILGHRILPNSKLSEYLWAIGIGTAVAAINYYVLQVDDRWARFKPEFEGYSARGRFLGRLAIFAAIIAIAAAALFSAAAAKHLP